MEPMNAFINSHRQEFKAYIDAICSISADHNASRIPPSYTTPITIFSRLPQTSKEGFPSLPYLIDQSRELATLINLWIEASSGKSDTGDSGDLVAFTHLCNALRKQTRDTVNRAMNSDRPTSDLQSNWVEILENFDRQARISDRREPGSDRDSPEKSVPSPNAASGPVAAFSRVARRFKGTSITTGNHSSVSLSSPQGSSAGPSPHRPQSPFQHGTFTGQSSPFIPSPPLPESMTASSVWDPGTDGRFPPHALAWDHDEGAESPSAGANGPGYFDDTDSFGNSSDIRGPLGISRPLARIETANRSRSLDVENGSMQEEPVATGTGTESEKSPTSPREGRRLVDIMGLRKKDKDGIKDKDRGGTGSGASEAGRSDGEGRNRTLTKRQTRDRDREGERGKGKKKDK